MIIVGDVDTNDGLVIDFAGSVRLMGDPLRLRHLYKSVHDRGDLAMVYYGRFGGGSGSGVADGGSYFLSRTNSIRGIAPTALEVPSPVSGDSAIIELLNGTVEAWKYSGSWSLVQTVPPVGGVFSSLPSLVEWGDDEYIG